MNASPAFALKSAAWLLALALVALPVVGVMQGWFAVGRWPLRQLRIDGPFEHVSAAQVRAAVRPHIKPGFFAVPLGQVRVAVEQLPWVDTVDVRKRWPDVLEVRLRERSAAAIWQGGELVDVEGKLFAVPASSVPAGLPRFAGPRSRVREVLDFFRETAPQVAPYDMHVAAVQMSRRGGWSLRLEDGTELVLGTEDARPRLARFLAVQAPLAAAASAHMLRADLRYANGFAVAWQPLPPPPAPVAPVLNPSPHGRGVGVRGRACLEDGLDSAQARPLIRRCAPPRPAPRPERSVRAFEDARAGGSQAASSLPEGRRDELVAPQPTLPSPTTEALPPQVTPRLSTHTRSREILRA